MGNKQAHNDEPNKVQPNFSIVLLNETELDGVITKQLKSFDHQMKIYEDDFDCEYYIRGAELNERIVLIVSELLSKDIIIRIHHLSQLIKIFVLVDHSTDHEWSKSFIKVRTIELNQLLPQIEAIQSFLLRHTLDPLDVAYFDSSKRVGFTSTDINGSFLFSQLLVDILLRMNPQPTDKDELIQHCIKAYDCVEAKLSQVRDFRDWYKREDALKWYSKTSFVFALLNHALRVQNIDLLFLYRFFLQDLQQQISAHQCKIPMTVYRGQLMTNEEFERISNSIGQLISVNSFLSTSISPAIAKSFHGDVTLNHTDKQYILFKIYADPEVLNKIDAGDNQNKHQTKSFAYISDIAGNEDEEEVLFMLGSIFRLEKVYREYSEESQVWIIELTLCGEQDNVLKDAFTTMKREYGDNSIDNIEDATLNSFATVLYEMRKLDLADKFFRRLNRELPLADTFNRARCYHCIGVVALKQQHFDESLKWLNRALDTCEPLQHPKLGVTYLCIGNVYFTQKRFDRALKFYRMALGVLLQGYGEEHYLTAACYMNMANLYYVQKHLKEAREFYTKALFIEQNRESPNSALIYNNLGNVLDELDETREAIACYEKASNVGDNNVPFYLNDEVCADL